MERLKPFGQSEPRRGPWRNLVPYVLLPPVGALGLHTWRTETLGAAEVGVAVAASALVGVAVWRQVVALADTRRLAHASAAIAGRMERRNAGLVGANARLAGLATTDLLTGLPNHRGMVEAMDREIERSRRYNRPFALLFLALDHFKALNDAYGHAAGDACLREWARVVGEDLRATDTLGRWGGEEFVVVMPELGCDDATAAAERVRAAVARHAFASGGGLHLTCSIGLACYPADATDRDRLVALADRALYTAKRLGRNQVRAVNDPAVLAAGGEAGAGGTREDTALTGTIEALVSLVEARDQYTGQHTCDVGRLARRVAVALGLSAPDARMIGLAGRLHDIGKVAVPDAVLHKAGPLTPAEWVLVRTHAAVGADIVGGVPALRPLAPLVRGHHERWDGGGYPDRLVGAEIPLGARVLAVVDAFEAITTERPYRPARSPAWALAELRRAGGAQFDPAVVGALAEVLAADPSTPPLRPGIAALSRVA